MDNHQDEFDIEEIAEKLYRLSIRIVRKLASPLVLLWRNPLRSAFWLISSIALAFLLSILLPETYESKFILTPHNTTDLTFINMIEDLYALSRSEDHEGLFRELGIDTEVAHTIKSIESEIIWDGKFHDSVRLAIIILQCSDTGAFIPLQNAILDYFELNPHYIKAEGERVEETGIMVEHIREELIELDSIKAYLIKQTVPRGNGVIYGSPPDLMRIYEAELGLQGRKIVFEQENNRQGNFELVKPCVVASKPIFPKFGALLLLLLPFALVIAMLNARKQKS